MLPGSRPQASRAIVTKHAAAAWKRAGRPGPLPNLYVMGVRGYYFRTMGDPKANDRGIYDDAIFVVGPDTFTAFNANVDPSGYRKGSGTGSTKGMASLKNGVWSYRPGPHPLKNGYPAFRQAAAVTVVRDGSPPYEDTGMFGINIHRGGIRTTSSAGCQTLPPAQWAAFQSLLMMELRQVGRTVFPYILIDGPIT